MSEGPVSPETLPDIPPEDGENPVIKIRSNKPGYPPSRTRGLRPPWKKGECANPGGRPKGVMSGALWEQLMRKKGFDLKLVTEGIINSAREGNPKAYAVMRDSIDGRPVTSVELNVTGKIDLALRLEQARKALGNGEDD